MKPADFYIRAVEKYGDKINVIQITPGPKMISMMPEFAEAVKNYPEQAWLVKNECPECSASFEGFFSSFTWGTAHGRGTCGVCTKVTLRLYHYPLEGSEERFVGYSLEGFTE